MDPAIVNAPSALGALKLAVNRVIDAYVSVQLDSKPDAQLTVGDVRRMKAEAVEVAARQAFKRQQGREPDMKELQEFIDRNGPP